MSKPAAIRCKATLLEPAAPAGADWLLLSLPAAASAKLPSRSMVSVTGMVAGHRLQTTLQPDGQGGHWLKVDKALRQAAGVSAGRRWRWRLSQLPKSPSRWCRTICMRRWQRIRPRVRAGTTSLPWRGATGSSGLCLAKTHRRVANASPLRATCRRPANAVRAASIVPGCTVNRLRHPCRNRAEATGMVLDLPLYMRRNAYMRHTSAHLYSGAVPPQRF